MSVQTCSSLGHHVVNEGHNTVERDEDNKPIKSKSRPNTEIVTGAVERGVENV